MSKEKAKEKRGHWQERTKRRRPRRMVKDREKSERRKKKSEGRKW